MSPLQHRSQPARALFRLALLFLSTLAHAAEPDLRNYQALKDAKTATIQDAGQKTEGQTGYLGVVVEGGALKCPLIAEVGPGSPASLAGLQAGDRILSLNGAEVKSADALRAALQVLAPDGRVAIAIDRGGNKQSLSATLGATSRPMQLGERAILGVRMVAASDRPGIDIASVTADKPAARAGLRAGDRIMKVDEDELGEAKSLSDVLLEKRPGDSVTIVHGRSGKLFRKRVPLVADDSDTAPLPEERRVLTTWKKPVFRLAVICIEFPDAKHNGKIPLREWEQAYFSRGVYNQKNATGQQVYGSMADYYDEVSCGKLRVEGRAFDWIEAKKKRLEYNQPQRSKAKSEFFNETVQAVLQRDGAGALQDVDGLAFIYAGTKPPEVQRSSILWPHRSSVKIGDKSWPYVIVTEGGDRMATISTMCHEFGHILGLPDLYARPENPGSEGAGVWAVMSNQARNGRPQHFDAWCKEQLGWLTPVVLDPAVKQKLILGPVEGSTTECAKILVRPDGGEYLLLENRRRTGFDASLPAEGLLIWRVVANRPILEESHGVTGPAGPRVFLRSVPYPTPHNESFTPYTTPSSRSQMGGGLPVYISNIRQLADGRIAFQIGYEYD